MQPGWNVINSPTNIAFKDVLIHEFGHILGFDHEMVNPLADHVGGLDCYKNAPAANATVYGNQAADPNSIMGAGPAPKYCTPVFAFSQNDINAVRQLYGTPPAPVTAVSNGAGGMSLFRMDGAGRVYVRDWVGPPANLWNSWTQIGTAAFPQQTIAAASRNSAHEDLFVRDSAGKIWTTYRENGGPWASWFIVGGHADTFATEVSAVAKADVVTIVAMKSDNIPYTTHWDLNDAAQRWPTWKKLDGGPSFGATQRIALAQVGKEVRFYGVGANASTIYTRRRTSSYGWTSWGSIGSGFPIQHLTAMNRGSEFFVFARSLTANLFVSYTSANGVVQSAFSMIGSSSDAFPFSSDIAAISRTSNQVDVFGRKADGKIYNTWSITPTASPSNPNPVPGPWASWFLLPGTSSLSAAPGNIGLSTKGSTHVQAFTVGYNATTKSHNEVLTSKWESGVSDWGAFTSLGEPFDP